MMEKKMLSREDFMAESLRNNFNVWLDEQIQSEK